MKRPSLTQKQKQMLEFRQRVNKKREKIVSETSVSEPPFDPNPSISENTPPQKPSYKEGTKKSFLGGVSSTKERVSSVPSSPETKKVSSLKKLNETMKKEKAKGMVRKVPEHLIVDALAGTGKTFTIIEGVKRLKGVATPGVAGSEQQEEIWKEIVRGPAPESIVVLAFNNSIATELERRVPKGVTAQTSHKFGRMMLHKSGLRFELVKEKTLWLMEDELGEKINRLRQIRKNFVKPIQKLVSLSKVNLTDYSNEATAHEELDKLIEKYDVELGHEWLDEAYYLVPRLLELSKDRSNMIDFDDMIWLPTALGLSSRKIDLLLVDERQDLNAAQQELILNNGKRIVVVGDQHQAIYGFAGADYEACENLERRLGQSFLGVKKLPLTVTRRCAQLVVEEARAQVPQLEYLPDAPLGEIRFDEEESFLEKVQKQDMVLCRTNAPLVRHAMKLLKQRIPVRIQGRSIGDEMKAIIRSFKTEEPMEIIEAAGEWYTETTNRLAKRKFGAEDLLIAVKDQYETILALTENAKSAKAICDDIDKLFSDDVREGVLFSSIHRAKGLEAKSVWFLQYDKCPHPMARTEGQKGQEQNLIYIAKTRAIHTLTYVSSAR